MSKPPIFTILTASLNSETTIDKSLHSVRKQTFQNLEHIIVDGGSDDRTIEIIKQHERFYNLIWLSEPDNGIAEALNKGIERASGKYILVLGADDYFLDGNTLHDAYDIVKDERFDIYSSPVVVDHPTKGKFGYKPFRILWWHHFKTIFPHQGTFVHNRIFKHVGKFCEDFYIAFDYDFFYRALKFKPTIKFGSKPISIMGGAGISGNQNFINWRLNEEMLIQNTNESQPIWKILQLIFRTLYFPYKTKLLPSLIKSGSPR